MNRIRGLSALAPKPAQIRAELIRSGVIVREGDGFSVTRCVLPPERVILRLDRLAQKAARRIIAAAKT